MSGHDLGRGHERARELAAIRADEYLSPDDEAWLADHLEFCDACAAIAADYDAQHDLFEDLRGWSPQPPRDLWARTAAAIDAERGRGAGARGSRRLGRPMALRLSLAPIAVGVAAVVVVGGGLLNSSPAAPSGGGTAAAGATPIALAQAADLQVITRDSDGNLQVLSRPMNEVCPIGVDACGAQPTFAITSVSGVKAAATTLQGAISPSGDRMVVVAQDGNGDGVYVIPMRAARPAPSKSPAPSASAAASPSLPTASATVMITSSASTPASASTEPSVSPAAPSASASSEPTDTATNDPSASPSASPSGSPAPSETPKASAASPTEEPTDTPPPTIEVTPSPEAAIRIASGVTVAGTPVYAPDGSHLAFAATPSDGSTGPDIYVWTAGEKTARAITTDHGSWLAGWTADGILASRVVGGTPATFLLDPATGHADQVGDDGTWLPVVSPDGQSAAWWNGTLKASSDGHGWVPDSGKLVLGVWPNTSTSNRQVLAKSGVADWVARWSDDGAAIAVWIDAQGKGAGKLSLYRVDSGIADLANPMLDGAAANPGFSLRTGRLAWTTPSQAPAQVVEVLAWNGKSVGRLQVPADGNGAVLP